MTSPTPAGPADAQQLAEDDRWQLGAQLHQHRGAASAGEEAHRQTAELPIAWAA